MTAFRLLPVALLLAQIGCATGATAGDDGPGARPSHDGSPLDDTGDSGGAETTNAQGDGGSTGADGGSTNGGGTSGDGGGAQVDLSEECDPQIQGWPEAWASMEDEVLTLTNQARAQSQDCGKYGRFPATGPLEMDPSLRCAARYHSLWMEQTGIFDHYSYGGDLGDDPWQRMANAGFDGTPIGENIAAGYPTPAAVVAGWIDSDGHCANLMNSEATLIGVGYAEGGSYGTWWAQDFGR